MAGGGRVRHRHDGPGGGDRLLTRRLLREVRAGRGDDLAGGREAIVRGHRDHLSELVAARTQEPMAAKVAAESANVAKSEFLANVS